jgi:beta-phosphoglucomutase
VLRAILFDFNGVLVDDEPLHLELFQRVLAEERMAVSLGDYCARYLGQDDRSCFAAALAEAGRDVEETLVTRLVARKASYYQEITHATGYPLVAGALELVQAAAARGLMLGVVTGALREELEGALRQADLREHFKVLITAEDVAESKPSPRGYSMALERLNSLPPLPERLIHPHEVAAVEDTPAGLEAASGAGLFTLAVVKTYSARALSRAEMAVECLGAGVLGALEARMAEAAG